MLTRRLGLSIALLAWASGRAEGGDFSPAQPGAVPPRYVYSANQQYVMEVNASEEGSVVTATADPSRPLWTLRGVLPPIWGYILLSDDGTTVALVRDVAEERDAEGLRIVNRNGIVATYTVEEIERTDEKYSGGERFSFVGSRISCRSPTPPWVSGAASEGDRFVIQTRYGRNHTFLYTGEPAPPRYYRWLGFAGIVMVVGGTIFLVGRYCLSGVPASQTDHGAGETEMG